MGFHGQWEDHGDVAIGFVEQKLVYAEHFVGM